MSFNLFRPLTAVIVGCALIAVVLFTVLKQDKTPHGPRVALLFPAVHPSMAQIEKGFVSTLKEALPAVSIDSYNANCDKVLMKGQAEKVTADYYDLIFTVGTNASQLVKTALVKKGKHTPLIFAAVSDPVKRGLVNPDDAQEQVTGVIENYDHNDQIDMLLLARPDVKKIVLVYDSASNPAFEEEKNTFQKLFAHRGIALSPVAVFALRDIQQKVPALLGDAQVVMTFTDHTVCSAMDSLIKICNQAGVTLFTSELDSNDKGAALSYGVYESEYGSEGAKKAIAILIDHTPARDIPITPLQNFYLKVNAETAPAQNVALTPALTEHPRVLVSKKEMS